MPQTTESIGLTVLAAPAFTGQEISQPGSWRPAHVPQLPWVPHRGWRPTFSWSLFCPSPCMPSRGTLGAWQRPGLGLPGGP